MAFSELADHVGGEDAIDIRETLSGKDSAYERIVLRHQERVAARMWRFTRDRGNHQELVHEVFVQAFLSLRTYEARAPFEHWLARIATSVGYRHWKRKERDRHRSDTPIEELADALAQGADRLEAAQAADLLDTLLGKLAPRDRLVLLLRHVEERSVEETAKLTGWTQSMVKVQAWRARRKLKGILQEAGLEDAL